MINPTAFTIFGIDIKWYGIAYVISFILAEKLIEYYIKNYPEIKITLNEKDDFISYTMLGIFIGGRIGEFLFYQPTIFTYEIFNIREGGMSFHGGLLGIIIAIFIYSKKHNKSFLEITDLIVLAAPIGLFLGRIANYINDELHGLDILGIKYEIVLYEAFFEGFLLFFILNLTKNFQKKGQNSTKFMFFYGFFRFFLEFLKPPIGILGIHMGQFLSLLMLLFSIFFYYINNAFKIIEK